MPEKKTKHEGKSSRRPERRGRRNVEIEYKDFDLEKFAARYVGHTKVIRLLFVAKRCPNVRMEAFKAALAELRKSTNTQFMVDACNVIKQTLGEGNVPPELSLDDEWLKGANRRYADKYAQLDENLNIKIRASKTDEIREAYIALAEHLAQRGDFTQALNKYMEINNYTGDQPIHALNAALNTMTMSILSGSFGHVKSQSNAAQQNPAIKNNSVAEGKVLASLGLFDLKRTSYRGAADYFLSTPFELEGNYQEVICGEDVAIYGTLCALATFSRADLRTKVLDNESFRKYMELVPSLQRMVETYISCQYGECFGLVGKIEKDCGLDFYLAHHFQRLVKKMRDRAMVQYFSPFISVRIPHMARAFNIDPQVLESELVSLIADNKIQGRIDSQNKVLCAKNADNRVTTFQQALNSGEQFIREAKSQLLRMSLIKNGLIVKHRNQRSMDDDDDLMRMIM